MHRGQILLATIRRARVERWVEPKGFGFASELAPLSGGGTSTPFKGSREMSSSIFIHRSELTGGRRRLEEGQIISIEEAALPGGKQRVTVELASPSEWALERGSNAARSPHYNKGSDRVLLTDVDFDFATDYDSTETVFTLGQHTAIFRS